MIRKAAIFAVIVTMVLAVASCSKNESSGPKDKGKPTVSITNAWDTAKVGGIVRDGIVDVTVAAFDDAGINRVELYANNSLVGTDTTKPYELEWDMASISNGTTVAIFAKAVDANGNSEVTDNISITKGATAAPVAAMTSPSDGATVMQGAKLTFTGTASDADEGDLSDSQISWSSNLQGVLGQGKTLDHRGLVIGDHIITMIATDSNGVVDMKKADVTVTDNTDFYATIEAGTYEIAGPIFPTSTVVLTQGFYVYKTELSVNEFLEALKHELGEPAKKAGWHYWAEGRNEDLYEEEDAEGLYPNCILYKTNFGKYQTKDPFYDGEGGEIEGVFGNYPASFIFYIEAIQACNGLSKRDGLTSAYEFQDKNGVAQDEYNKTKTKSIFYDNTADGWRLPTEAEWEVAARGGLVDNKFPWGDTGPGGLCNSLTDMTPPKVLDIYNGRGIVPVDSYEPNRYGLYNVVGNVAEMCTDMFMGQTATGINPVGYHEGKSPDYLAKGGAWYEYGPSMQVAMRHITMPFSTKEKASYNSGVGLRPVRFAK